MKLSLRSFVLLCALALPGGAVAQSPVTRVEILPGWVEADGRRMAALRVQLQPGWHTYWRIPGEAGIAPVLDWSASQNLGTIRAIWPQPQIYAQNGYVSYVYHDELILPLEIAPTRAGRPVALVGALTLGVCRDTCVPVDLAVSGALRGDGASDARIQTALTQRAIPGARAGLGQATCAFQPTERGADLTVRASIAGADSDHLVIELPASGPRIAHQVTTREGDELVTRARLRADRGAPMVVDRASLGLTVLAEGRMLTAQGCIGTN